MKKILILTFLCSSLLVIKCMASPYGFIHDNYTLDVYRSNQIKAEMVDKIYHKELRQIASIMLNAKSMPTEENRMGLDPLFNKVMNGLRKSGNFVYLGLSPVTYPGGSRIGFTVDVVDASDKQRLDAFLPKPTATFSDPDHLIASWHSYEKYGFNYFLRTKTAITFNKCSAFHCVYGFERPELKSYEKKFNEGVPKYKDQLIAILRGDKDEQNRGAAAYLLAHLKDGKEVVDVLSPSINDSSSYVRNNAMRVIAQTSTKVSDANFPVDDVIRALTYPSETDRNKAIYVLEMLTVKPMLAAYVKQHGCHQVMDQYKTVQPNLHGEAYHILVNISGKHYPVNDYQAWENWEKNNC